MHTDPPDDTAGATALVWVYLVGAAVACFTAGLITGVLFMCR